MRCSIIKVCIRPVGLCMVGATALALTACTALSTKNSTVNPVEAPVNDAFAAEVAVMAEGSAASLASPLGVDSLVSVGALYTSALGQQCRPVSVTVSGGVHRLSVRQGEQGWYTVDSIFEAMPR